MLKRLEGPVRSLAVLLEYLRVRPQAQGYKGVLQGIGLLQSCLGSLGLVVSGYNTHSFRIGRATDIFDNN